MDTPTSTPSPTDAAKATLAEIQADPAHPLWSDPDGLRKLYVDVYGTRPVLTVAGPEAPTPEHAPATPTDASGTDLPFDLSPLEGEQWQVPTLAELHSTATALGVPAAEQGQWFAAYRALKSGRAQPPDVNATIAHLRQEYGADAPRAARAFDLAFARLPRTVQDAIDAVDLPADPTFYRRLVKAGGPLLRASEELERIYQNPKHPWHDPEHPDHATAAARVRQLHVIVHGDRRVF